MNVGAELREARQRAGLSREEVSQRTKIQLAKIEALEANAFERLPEGVYLDGLVRAYANQVGLDGSEIVARLHRDKALPEGDLLLRREDEFAAEDQSDRIVPPGAAPVTRPGLPVSTAPAVHAHEVIHNLSRPVLFDSQTTAAPHRGRMLVPIVAMVAAIGLGAYLYDRTRPFAEREDIAAPAISHENQAEAQRAAGASRTPVPVPADAVAADRPATSEHHAEKATEAQSPAAARRDSASSRIEGVNAPSAPVTPVPHPSVDEALAAAAREGLRANAAHNASPPAADEARAASRGTSASATRAADASGVADLSGFWTLDTRVESSQLDHFEGLQLGYRIQLQQAGNRISGEGVKILENGKSLGATAQTPIAVEGTLDGTRLTLNFVERGTRRESAGKMILDLNEDGVMRGRFSSSAARSSGTAEARRPEG